MSTRCFFYYCFNLAVPARLLPQLCNKIYRFTCKIETNRKKRCPKTDQFKVNLALEQAQHIKLDLHSETRNFTHPLVSLRCIF